MTLAATRGVTVHDMRVRALPAVVRRLGISSPSAVDAVAALIVLAVAVEAVASRRDAVPGVAIACAVIMAGAVAVRHRLPALTALAALAGLLGYELSTHDLILASPPVAVMLTCYTLGRSGARDRHAARLILVACCGLATIAIFSVPVKGSPGSTAASWLVAVVAPLTIGLLLARRSRLSRQLVATATQLQTERDHNAAQATAEERNRVARELHDVVAHCVSVMVVQAGAARLIAAHDRAAADRALAIIGDTGRDAMADLRRMVGVLRRADDPDFGRGAGLADLEPLIERIRAAGVPTELRARHSAGVSPEVDVVAFRVVQEALTNVVKHAGEGATATVEIQVGADELVVEVTNSQAAARRAFASSGHGLRGMRERVAARGGELRVGPRPDGSYRVRAQIPLRQSDVMGAGPRVAPGRRAFPRLLRPSEKAANLIVVAFWLSVMEIDAATSSARGGPSLLAAAVVAAMAVAAAWRRRYPLAFLTVVGGLASVLSTGLTSLDRSTITGFYSLVVPLFTVAAWAPLNRATAGLALWAAGSAGLAFARNNGTDGLLGALVMALVVWAAGRVWRAQVLLAADLTETTTRLAAERDQRARLAVLTERTRIARDLHGPVAAGVINMVVRAEAARTLLKHQPTQAETAIRDIEQTGRDALTQLRRILGVLRSPADPATTTVTGVGTHTPAGTLCEARGATPLQQVPA
jgi:signal transduction histidine kinase